MIKQTMKPGTATADLIRNKLGRVGVPRNLIICAIFEINCARVATAATVGVAHVSISWSNAVHTAKSRWVTCDLTEVIDLTQSV